MSPHVDGRLPRLLGPGGATRLAELLERAAQQSGEVHVRIELRLVAGRCESATVETIVGRERLRLGA